MGERVSSYAALRWTWMAGALSNPSQFPGIEPRTISLDACSEGTFVRIP